MKMTSMSYETYTLNSFHIPNIVLAHSTRKTKFQTTNCENKAGHMNPVA